MGAIIIDKNTKCWYCEKKIGNEQFVAYNIEQVEIAHLECHDDIIARDIVLEVFDGEDTILTRALRQIRKDDKKYKQQKKVK